MLIAITLENKVLRVGVAVVLNMGSVLADNLQIQSAWNQPAATSQTNNPVVVNSSDASPLEQFLQEIEQANEEIRNQPSINHEEYYLINLNILVDPEMRENLGEEWKNILLGCVNYTNNLYGQINLRSHGPKKIRFQINAIKYRDMRNAHGNIRNGDNILRTLEEETAADSRNFVVYLTGDDIYCMDGGTRLNSLIGYADPDTRCCTIEVPPTLKYKKKIQKLKETFAHELGHLLGADDSNTLSSVMYRHDNTGNVRGIDLAARRRIAQYTLHARERISSANRVNHRPRENTYGR